MAVMIPVRESRAEFNSLGEWQIYNALKRLPQEYIIFHSIRYTKQPEDRNPQSEGEADFAVFHPRHGILTIEAKDGGIVFRNNDCFQVNRKTGDEYYINPMGQANECARTFMGLLRNQKPSLPWRVYAAVWFATPTELPRNTSAYYPPEVVLLQGDIADPEPALQRAFAYYGMRETKLVASVEETVQRLAPSFGLIPSTASAARGQELLFNRMTREQSGLLDYLEEQRVAAVQGGAGTGKTLMAIEKAKRLAKNEQVLFLCVNTRLRQYLVNRYAAQNPSIHFDSLRHMVSKTLRGNASDETISAYLDDLYLEDEADWRFRHIIIDEGQDFLPDQVERLREIADARAGCFYVFYDRNQKVQNWQALKWLDSMYCRLVLSRNCRNTMQIAET